MFSSSDPLARKQMERRQMVTDLGTLEKVCGHYFFRKSNSIRSENTRNQYRYAIKSLSEHLGREPTVSDLDDDIITAWQIAILATGISPATAREKVGRVTALWSWLHRGGYVPIAPTVEKPHCPNPEPKSWTEEELERLFEAAQFEDGFIADVPARDWWFAWLLFIWHTAERKSAAMAVRWEWVDFLRRAVYVPAGVRKGGAKSAYYRLEDYVIAALEKIQKPERDLVFPWDRCEGSYYYRFGRILKRAKLPGGRKRKTHALRVSHATWATIIGKNASKALLHSDPATTERHYVDRTLAPNNSDSLPPPWGLTPGG